MYSSPVNWQQRKRKKANISHRHERKSGDFRQARAGYNLILRGIFKGPSARTSCVFAELVYVLCIRAYIRVHARANARAAAHVRRALQVTKRSVSGSSAPWNLRDREWYSASTLIRATLSLSLPVYVCLSVRPSVCLSIYLSISPLVRSSFRCAHEFNPRGISRSSQTSQAHRAPHLWTWTRVQRLSTSTITNGLRGPLRIRSIKTR